MTPSSTSTSTSSSTSSSTSASPLSPAIDAKQVALQQALGRMTVSELVVCKETLRTFRVFLATGTPRQQQRLCAPPASAPFASPPHLRLQRGRLRRRAHVSAVSRIPPSPCRSTTTSTAATPTPRPAGSPNSTPSPPAASGSTSDSPGHHKWTGEEGSLLPSPSLSPSSSTWTRCASPGPSLPSPALSPISPAPSWSSHEHADTDASITLQAHHYFRSRLGAARQHRAHYLVRAVQGFIDASTVSPDFAQEIWRAGPNIFASLTEGTGLVARLRRLYDGHCRIKKSREDYSCADRLCYILLDHDLQQLVLSGELVMSQGRGKKTAALYKQAWDISTTVDELRANRKAGSGYRHLLYLGGPGFLLQMGSQVSTIWERKLSKADIHLVVKFLEEKVPEVYQKGKALSPIAARALVNGFLAYGWTLSELNRTGSSLIDQLKLHINMTEEPEDIKLDTPRELAASQLNGGQETPSLSDHESEALLQCRNMETDHKALLQHPVDLAFSPAVRSPIRNPASFSPSTSPRGDLFAAQQYECYDFPSAPPNHALVELPLDSDEARLAGQTCDAEMQSYDLSDTISPAREHPLTGDAILMMSHTPPMDCRGVDDFNPTSDLPSNMDLYLLLGMDLDDPITSNTNSILAGAGTSSDAQSRPVSSRLLSPGSIMAPTTDIYDNNWTGDLGEVDMEGGECRLPDSGADPFWEMVTYMSRGDFGWNAPADGA